MSSKRATGDDNISSVTCPRGQYVTGCVCEPLVKGGYCDGATVTPDARTCRAHAAFGGRAVRVSETQSLLLRNQNELYQIKLEISEELKCKARKRKCGDSTVHPVIISSIALRFFNASMLSL